MGTRDDVRPDDGVVANIYTRFIVLLLPGIVHTQKSSAEHWVAKVFGPAPRTGGPAGIGVLRSRVRRASRRETEINHRRVQ